MITIAIAAVALGVAVMALRPRRPVVFVRNPIVSMGTVPQRSRGRASWLIKNRGSAPLPIWIEAASNHFGGRPYPKGLQGGTTTVPAGGSTKLSVAYIINDRLGRESRGLHLARTTRTNQSSSSGPSSTLPHATCPIESSWGQSRSMRSRTAPAERQERRRSRSRWVFDPLFVT
jgi:hypothetical protein